MRLCKYQRLHTINSWRRYTGAEFRSEVASPTLSPNEMAERFFAEPTQSAFRAVEKAIRFRAHCTRMRLLTEYLRSQ